MISAWLATFDATCSADRFSDPVMFGATGVAGGAWWLFAFALGTAAGGLTRRTLPAFAVTIVVFVLALFAVIKSREHYAEPLVAESGVDGMRVPGDALVTGSGVLGADGERMSWGEAMSVCDGLEAVGCMRDRGYVRQYTLYQPADRYWRFQWTETGLLLVVTLVLTGVTARRVVSRSR